MSTFRCAPPSPEEFRKQLSEFMKQHFPGVTNPAFATDEETGDPAPPPTAPSSDAFQFTYKPRDVKAHLDRFVIKQEEAKKLLEIESELQKRVVSQRPAISALARAIRRSRAGLKNPSKPVGSFLFLGPTGVGKTEVAKTLGSFLFGSERSLIRFDMSEFMEKHAVAKFIGSPPVIFANLIDEANSRSAHERALARASSSPSSICG